MIQINRSKLDGLLTVWHSRYSSVEAARRGDSNEDETVVHLITVKDVLVFDFEYEEAYLKAGLELIKTLLELEGEARRTLEIFFTAQTSVGLLETIDSISETGKNFLRKLASVSQTRVALNAIVKAIILVNTNIPK